jgi:hypothetical protein
VGSEQVFMAIVLCTGSDRALIKTRKLILQKAGHEVFTAMDESGVKSACQKRAFDVAVIGQTAIRKTKHELLDAIRRYCPSAKILELYQSHRGKTLSEADSWLEVPADVPDELAERVNSLAIK